MSWVTLWVGDVNGFVSSSLLLDYVRAYTCCCGIGISTTSKDLLLTFIAFENDVR
jgi:hypothetical protein